MKKSVLIVVVTVSLAVVAAQVGNNPSSLNNLQAHTAGIFSADNEQTWSQHGFKMGASFPAIGAPAPSPNFNGSAHIPGKVFAQEMSKREESSEGREPRYVLNEDDDEEGEDDDADEEEEEGWDRIWDAPKLA